VIVLDTNVLSEFLREAPHQEVVRWLDGQPRTSIWTTSISVYEIRSGLLSMPAGKRQKLLIAAFEHLLEEAIQGRIATFDRPAAQHAAELEAASRNKGRPRDARDTIIAGIVLASHATLATRNLKHFDDIASSVVNPWDKG
jgi:hypothetical protein